MSEAAVALARANEAAARAAHLAADLSSAQIEIARLGAESAQAQSLLQNERDARVQFLGATALATASAFGAMVVVILFAARRKPVTIVEQHRHYHAARGVSPYEDRPGDLALVPLDGTEADELIDELEKLFNE